MTSVDERGERDSGRCEEGCILVEKFMGEAIEVVPVEDAERATIGAVFSEAMATGSTSCNLDFVSYRCSNPEYHKWLRSGVNPFGFYTPTATSRLGAMGEG